ncbi:MAG TPA: TcpE family conjugal transfer membrane protein, partial [Streptosporangiaceae bacterium]|nr:TcpE family conjugal transfer membrane protein [Streptosporangiaceae bacterium]
MELPTYTNIWKIEKRLYKLYDFRLPMPLPIGQVTAFLAIAVPYMLILTLAGMPFSHTWVWLYVLPPGVLAWLVTRPVLEGKRLPELVLSQLRYLAEPRTWCRMAPAAEKDLIVVVARVWRAPVAAAETGPAAGLTQAGSIVGEAEAGPAAVDATAACLPQEDSAHPAPPAWPDRPAVSSRVRARAVDAALLGRVRTAGSAGPARLPAARPAPDAGVPDGAEVGDAAQAVDAADAAGVGSTAHSSAAGPGGAAPAAGGMADESPASPTGPAVA